MLRRRSAAATVPVRARQVLSDSDWLFRASKIIDGWFRQLERLVRLPFEDISHLTICQI